MANGHKACGTEGCDKPATPHTDHCKNCNHVFYYWARRRVAQIVARRDFIAKTTSRMAHVFELQGINKDGSVRPTPPRPKIRPPSTAKTVARND